MAAAALTFTNAGFSCIPDRRSSTMGQGYFLLDAILKKTILAKTQSLHSYSVRDLYTVIIETSDGEPQLALRALSVCGHGSHRSPWWCGEE